ncbi:MAG: hypothetical protein WBB73_03980 [Candidatus Aminicenantaceae bacterium]
MKKIISALLLTWLGAAWAPTLSGSDLPMLKLRGEYLAYSYDSNQIFGRDVTFEWSGYSVSCVRLKVDINARAFHALGRVILTRGDDTLSGDELVFDPEKARGNLIVFGKKIEEHYVGEPAEEEVLLTLPQLDELTLPHIQRSLLYCTCREIHITETYEVQGFEVTFYVEGLPSLSFSRFKLSDGLEQKGGGFSLDKVWYTRSQGLIGRASYNYSEKDLISSFTSLHYEERSFLKDYQGPARQADLLHATSLVYNSSTTLGFRGNYNSSRLWNTNLFVNKKWSNTISTNFDFALNKPVNFVGEAWFGAQALVSGGRYGELSVAGRSDLQHQIVGNLAYGTSLVRGLNIMLNSDYSRVKMGGSDDFSEILSGALSLAHSSRVFNLAADYYLNYDLMGSELLSRPQVRLGVNPLTFYGGLLSIQLNNILIYNHLKTSAEQEQTYSNNTILNLSTHPLDLPKGFSLDFRISAEQFVEKKQRNFTSGGFILNLRKKLSQDVYFETFYSAQSRRRTQNWLIEGTTSQDLSFILRANPKPWLNGWISVSYDPKLREWQQTFADISLGLFRSWRFHSLLNYDFLMNRMSNIDLYLIRDAGRFQIRFVWRSLSKQFLVELIPL